MVTFIEGTPFHNSATYGNRVLCPVFMAKDGVEYFVLNQVIEDHDIAWGKYEEEKSRRTVNEAKEFLTAHDGAYFVLSGSYEDPFAMLTEISEKGYTFSDPSSMFIDCRDHGGFVDFHGNLNEFSSAFHFRFYDMSLFKTVNEMVQKINQRHKTAKE